MRFVRSPEERDQNSSVTIFMAGGISNCPNWQDEFQEKILSKYQEDPQITFVNPRRIGDLAKDGNTAREQILWEERYLDEADYIIFWFPKESVCPITLFELGKHAQRFTSILGPVVTKYLNVGMDPEYPRRFDLEVQLPLIEASFASEFSYSIDDFVDKVASNLYLKLK